MFCPSSSVACQGQSFSGRRSTPYLAALSVGSPNVCGTCSWASPGNRFLGGFAENGTLKEKLSGDTVIFSPILWFFQHLGCSPEDTFTFLSDWSNGNIATKKLWTSASTMYKDLCFFFKHIWLHNSNNDNNSNCNNSTFKYANLAWVCSLYLTEMITEMFVYYSLLILPVLLYFAGNAFEANS